MRKIALLPFVLLLLGSRAQTQTIVCVKWPSPSYVEPACFFVYTPPNAAPSLPVLYLVNTGSDSAGFCSRVQDLLKKTMLPAALIVGVSTAPAINPDLGKLITPDYVDAKGLFNTEMADEEIYYRFLSTEVMPYVQKNHGGNVNMLASEGGADFTEYVLNHHAQAFHVYLSVTPFALFENNKNMEKAKTYFAARKEKKWVTRADHADMDDDLEYKLRRPDKYH
jgi:hypothetical protein